MAKILFSYTIKDIELVKDLELRLENDGYTVIKLHEEPMMGRTINERILTALKETDVFIPIITKDTSQNVLLEASQAIGYGQEKKRLSIIPIVFDGVEIPNLLATVQVLKASSEDLDDTANKISHYISHYLGESQAIEEEKKETIARLTENSETYIRESISRLEAKEKNYRNIAYLCYFLCGVSLIGAIIFLLFKGATLLNPKTELTTSEQIQLGLLGIVLLALIISISRYLFLIGKSFMVESLRNSDRIHAISFGEFYLKAYGDKVEWNEVKEAFQHWNIDGGSSFITQSATEFDPEIFKNIIEFTKMITTKK